jgi:uncharacterized protein (DUF1499 family)
VARRVRAARPPGRVGLVFTILAVVAAVVALLIMPVTALARIAGVMDWRIALRAFSYDLYAAIAAVVLGLLAFAINRLRAWGSFRLGGGAFAFLAGVGIMVPIGFNASRALRAAPIHDITTDTDNPPQFVAVLPERAATHAINSTDYDPKAAVLQHAYYRDIAPAVLPLDMNESFRRVLDEARLDGLRIIAADRDQGRIEAVATTLWIRFNDDVVFRLTALGPNSTKIDMRSESRVGGGDTGTNAARVRRFLRAIERTGPAE